MKLYLIGRLAGDCIETVDGCNFEDLLQSCQWWEENQQIVNTCWFLSSLLLVSTGLESLTSILDGHLLLSVRCVPVLIFQKTTWLVDQHLWCGRTIIGGHSVATSFHCTTVNLWVLPCCVAKTRVSYEQVKLTNNLYTEFVAHLLIQQGGVYDVYCSRPPGGDQGVLAFNFSSSQSTCICLNHKVWRLSVF